MGFSALDYSIVIAYLLGVTGIGIVISGRQHSSLDYFLGGRNLSDRKSVV